MPAITSRLKRLLILVHGWMGVVFCIPFAMWFLSGMVMMYSTYPGVSQSDRLARAPALDPEKIHVSPQQAYAVLHEDGPADSINLETFDGRPAYEFVSGRDRSIVYADDGGRQLGFPPNLTTRIAAAWTRQPANQAKFETLTQEDQWTVSEEFRRLRPLEKYTWPDGEQVYVSAVTGEVVQYTTRASRIAAYFGAIPHWLYFTPLRKRPLPWTRTVIWLSGLASISALGGLVVGVWIYSPSKRYARDGAASSIPYRGQKRWHMILGLLFGFFACTWAFSGMLSMDPFPGWQEGSTGNLGEQVDGELRGAPVDVGPCAAKSPQQALLQLGPGFGAKQAELATFDGKPYYLATGGDNKKRIVPLDGAPMDEFPADQIVGVLRQAIEPATIAEVRILSRYESYYLDRHDRLPLPALFIRLNDAEVSTLYIDLKTAHVVEVYSAGSRRNRWLYHGFHSLDLPWLYQYRPMWDIVVLTLLLGGAALSITALILAWRLLHRSLFAGPIQD